MNRQALAILACPAIAWLALGPGAARPAVDRGIPFGRHSDRTALWRRPPGDVLSGFKNMYNWRVVEAPGEDYPFRAWFFGWAVQDCNRNVAGNSGCDAIFAARSRSLDGPWEVYCGEGLWDGAMDADRWRPVVTAGSAINDQWHNGDPSVVRVGRMFYMAYSATGFNRDGKPENTPGDSDGDILSVMGASSTDGVNWTRTRGPILMHAPDVGSAPVKGGGAHMHGSYHRPALLRDDGRFRLWFDYWTEHGLCMGYAENRGNFMDPSAWRVVRAEAEPVLEEWPNPNVVRVGGLLFSYADPSGYANHPWTGRKIAEAVSADGVRWVVLGYVQPDDDTPAIHVPEAFVRRLAGGAYEVRVYYACQIGGEPYDYRYDRIRCMVRVVTRKDLAAYRAACADRGRAR